MKKIILLGLCIFGLVSSFGLVYAQKQPVVNMKFEGKDGGRVGSNFLKSSDFKIEDGKITATASEKLGSLSYSIIFKGDIDLNTLDIKGTVTGNENSNFNDGSLGDGHRRTSFSGTFEAELDPGKSKQDAAWSGTTNIKYQSSSFEGAFVQGPKVGINYPGTIKIESKDGKIVIPEGKAEKNAVKGKVTSVTGEVLYSEDCNGYTPLKPGTIIKKGSCISTLYDANTEIDFGYGKVIVPQLSLMKIDDTFSEEKIRKTKINLSMGAIRVILKKDANIRGDFSVTTPTADSAIRGSEMIVKVEKTTGKTTVYTTDDKSFVKGKKDLVEKEVLEGQKTTIDKNGKMTAPVPFDTAEVSVIPAFSKNGLKNTSKLSYIIGGIALLGLTVGSLYFLRRRKKI